MSNATDNEWLLDELNDEKARLLIPAMVILAILMVVGIAGNSLVVFFYGCKSKTTPATCFILTLAIFDLVACGVAMPVEIADMRHFYTFRSKEACRLLAFVNHVSVISSAFTITAIAIDRYRRICRPFNKQFSINQAKIICAVCGGLSLFFGWPAIVLYNVERVTIYSDDGYAVIGYDCTTDKGDGYKPYAWTFNGVLFVGFIAITIVLVVTYFLVGRQLYKHKKFRFYVANRPVRRTASGTTILSTTEYTSEQTMSPLPHTIPEEKEDEDDEKATDAEEEADDGVVVEYEGPDFDDPPAMMLESIPDLRELLNGLPEVDSDRPSSGVYGLVDIGNSRPNSGRPGSGPHMSRSSSVQTNVSVRSKRSILTVRSVTIDASHNQVFDIEPRDKSGTPTWRPGSARSDSTWSNSITRPGSPCSITTFSRTSSIASTHNGSAVGRKSGTSESRGNVNSGLRSSGSYQSALKRSRSSGETKRSKRSIKRTLSDSMVGRKVRRSFSNSSIGRKLRRTASTDSGKMDTDIDSIKDIRMKLLDVNTIKYTTIMLIIALVFVMSCLPYLCLAVWRVYAADDLVYQFSDAQLLWFQIGIRSYFLNGVINPFIYGFFNSQFRTFFYQAFCPCCKSADRSKVGDHSDSQKSPKVSVVRS